MPFFSYENLKQRSAAMTAARRGARGGLRGTQSGTYGEPVEGRPDFIAQNYYFDTGDNAYPQRYYLELLDGPDTDKRIDAVECPLVNGVQGNHPSAVERTWTTQDLYEEHQGFRQREFILTGRSGDRELDLLRFRKFRNFIEQYQRLSAENKNAFTRAKDIRLTLNFPFEGESYYASLVSFSYSRETATTRLSYAWTIRLLTQGYVARRWSVPESYRKRLDTPGEGFDHTAPAHPCRRLATDAIADAPPEQVPLVSDHDGVEDAVTLVAPQSGLDRTSGLGGGRASKAPDDNRELYRRARDAETGTLSRWNASPTYYESRFLVYSAVRWYFELRMQAAATLGFQFERVGLKVDIAWAQGDFSVVATGNAGPMGFMVGFGTSNRRLPAPVPSPTRAPRPLPFSPRPVVSFTCSSEHTSLADVAQDALGNRHAWPTLVTLNGWQDARTRGDGQPIAAGTTVLVPAPAGISPPGDDDLYGTDLLLRDGDLVQVGTNDISFVRGLPNLEQNLDHRMRTPRGSNKTFPGFGISVRVGQSLTSDVPGIYLSDLKGQPMRDHRVARVTYANVREEHDKLLGYVTVETVTRARRSTSFPMPGVL